MNTVNPLKRPLQVPSDPSNKLLCKNCKQDDVVLNLKTCGCLFCDSCDGDSQNICVSCRSEVDPKIKLSFTKNLKCKFYKINKCFNIAEYKCKCIQNFVCSSCLNSTHGKRLRECCVPEILRPKVTSDHEPCGMCDEFIAEFKMVLDPFTKICFNCKVNKNIKCVPYDTNSEWEQFCEDFGESSQMTSVKIKKLKQLLVSSGLVREQEIKKCKDAISELQKCLDEYTEQYDRHIITVKQQLDSFNKIANIFELDGKFITILLHLKNGILTLHGEQGKDQVINFLQFYREKNNYNPSAEQIKRFVIQKNCSRTHILKFPLPSTSISDVSTDSDGNFQEIIDNKVKPFFILVEMQSTVNKRQKILEDIEKHQDKWVQKNFFAVNDIVIILDDYAKDRHKYKRAKILKRGLYTSKVFLLDFGFEITVENSSIGKIGEINIDGKKSCFLAQLTGSVDVKCGFEQESSISNISPCQNLLPKAQHMHLIIQSEASF